MSDAVTGGPPDAGPPDDRVAADTALATPIAPRAARRETRDGAVAASAAGARRTHLGWTAAVAATTLAAGVLRLVSLQGSTLTPFYDAAVRSMSLSWHNFFYGAFDPGASVSVDKPPFDLWMQVLSVKTLGYTTFALILPAALSATLAVPLLYDLVRRFAGRAAGLASALALAVSPLSVVTSRSDTMDSTMMALLVASAWLLVRASERRQLRWLLGAAAALGLAFNVKLFEAMVAAPALAVAALLLWDAPRWQLRFRRLLAAGAVFVVVALWWVALVSLTPARSRPYPIGSTNGSIWNAVFVFNGVNRLVGGPSAQIGATARAPVAAAPAARAPVAPAGGVRPAVRARAPARVRGPTSGPGPFRLITHGPVDYAGLIGVELLAGVLFGGLALVIVRPALLARDAAGRRRVTRAGGAIAALALWLLTGYVLFSAGTRTHLRYLESFTPAVATAVGVGVVALGMRARRPLALGALLAALALTILDVAISTKSDPTQDAGHTVAIVLGAAIFAAAAAALLVRARGGAWPRWWRAGAVTAAVLCAVLAFPVARDVSLIRRHAGVSSILPTFSSRQVHRMSKYLRAQQRGARYEFASVAPSIAAQLIASDRRPILLLTTNANRPFVTLAQLKAGVAAGDVRFALAPGVCRDRSHRHRPACVPAVRWVKSHGVDVTAQLRLLRRNTGLLYRLGPRSLVAATRVRRS